MRLGAWKCDIKPDSLAYKIYGESTISERHRHRYEYNSAYVDVYKSRIERKREIQIQDWLRSWIEDHPFFIGVQYHPEYKVPLQTTSYFVNFVAAAVKQRNNFSISKDNRNLTFVYGDNKQ
jgi:CTP synthase